MCLFSKGMNPVQQRVVRERTPGPSCPQNPAGGLTSWSCCSCNQYTLSSAKEAGLFCGSFLRKGEVFASVGLSQNLKDLKDSPPSAFFFCFTLVTGPRRSLSPKLSDTRVYEPQIRARHQHARRARRGRDGGGARREVHLLVAGHPQPNPVENSLITRPA